MSIPTSKTEIESILRQRREKVIGVLKDGHAEKDAVKVDRATARLSEIDWVIERITRGTDDGK